MANLLPHLVDMPMSLGDHLHELRRRLVTPVLVMVALFIGGFFIEGRLKIALVQPLQKALMIVGPERASLAGIPYGTTKLLTPIELGESAMMSFQVAFLFALVVSIPVLIYQAWRFIAVGLKEQERQLSFLFIPAGVIFFYVGLVAGYYVGLPYLYAWLIDWSASDPISSRVDLRMSFYFDSFVALTFCFGLIMDIPWLVLVLVRVGVVTPQKLSKMRKYIVLGNIVAAACITPGGDLASLIATFIPMQVLFEAGLFASRFLKQRTPSSTTGDDHARA